MNKSDASILRAWTSHACTQKPTLEVSFSQSKRVKMSWACREKCLTCHLTVSHLLFATNMQHWNYLNGNIVTCMYVHSFWCFGNDNLSVKSSSTKPPTPFSLLLFCLELTGASRVNWRGPVFKCMRVLVQVFEETDQCPHTFEHLTINVSKDTVKSISDHCWHNSTVPLFSFVAVSSLLLVSF